MGLRLHTSFAIAMAAHGLLLLMSPWADESTLVLPIPDAPAEEATPAAPVAAPQQPLAIEFITLPKSAPSAAVPRSIPPASTQQAIGATGPVSSPSMPDKSHSITAADPPSGDNEILGPEKTPGSSSGSGFSLRMRRKQGPEIDGRRGSLLDDAIAAAPVPAGGGGPRSDLIRTEARIGLDSSATRTTGWRDSGGGTKTSVGEPFKAHIARDGKITFEDRPPIEAEVVRWGGIPMPMVVGKFDLTDAAMVAFGEVLYPYRKLKAMDQTRELRAAMAVRARGESLRGALLRFKKDLKKIWRDKSLSLQGRRTVIFSLWDECAEVGPADVTKTAASIREIIVAFVQREMPQASTKGFSEEELASLNAQRQSSQAFDPYP